MIKFLEVHKEYDGVRRVTALYGLSFEIASGGVVAIIGPSGSGKSTLLNLMGGLDQPTSGSVEIDGIRLDQLSEERRTLIRRDKIGFIFQFFNLLPTLSCLDNVAIPLHLRGWPPQKTEARARELLALVKLEHRSKHLPEELSGGERQRVAIARALSVYPPILLADEPTGNLDTQNGADILTLMHDLHDQLGTALVIVTHDVNVAEACPRVIALRDGQIVEDRSGKSSNFRTMTRITTQ